MDNKNRAKGIMAIIEVMKRVMAVYCLRSAAEKPVMANVNGNVLPAVLIPIHAARDIANIMWEEIKDSPIAEATVGEMDAKDEDKFDWRDPESYDQMLDKLSGYAEARANNATEESCAVCHLPIDDGQGNQICSTCMSLGLATKPELDTIDQAILSGMYERLCAAVEDNNDGLTDPVSSYAAPRFEISPQEAKALAKLMEGL